MGTWDTKIFSNDDAMDWLSELEQAGDLSLCEQCLEAVEIQGYYLEAPECVRILCSAEVLAALIGRPSREIPKELFEWVAAHGHLDPSPFIPKAVTKVTRVLAEHSELNEIWQENETNYPDWKARVLDLRFRLSGTP